MIKFIYREARGNILRPHFLWARDNRSAAGKERGGKLWCAGEAVDIVSFALATILLSFPEELGLGGNEGSLKNNLILCIVIFLWLVARARPDSFENDEVDNLNFSIARASSYSHWNARTCRFPRSLFRTEVGMLSDRGGFFHDQKWGTARWRCGMRFGEMKWVSVIPKKNFHYI